MAGRSCLARVARFALVWTCIGLVVGCGRVGVELLGMEEGAAGRDSGTRSDASVDAGGCTMACANAHGLASCDTGRCVVSCQIGFADCDGDPANGCEASTADVVASCGACGLRCVNGHGEPACVEGLCQPSCTPGFGDCDAISLNGCEAELASVGHCGMCGVTCVNEHGSTSCVRGVCAPRCADGYADCNADPDDGCETRVASDPMNCGGCGVRCNSVSEICVDRQCQISPCTAGRGECDGNAAVACETDLTVSIANCGFCGNVCSVANGAAGCANSVCGVANCASGYGDCDGRASNGCEVTLSSSVAHCGACRQSCTNAHGTTTCTRGSCAPSCSTGYGDCDANRSNGCEQSLGSVDHCGSCGLRCSPNGGTPICDVGVCNTLCDLTGVFALRVAIPTTWQGTSVLSAGSGTFVLWSRIQLEQSTTGMSGTLTPCGQTVPDFAASRGIGEQYGVVYPNARFDGTPLPSTATAVSLSTASPGATFALARTAYAIGVSLADPVNTVWPSARGLVQVDVDADGKPGVTASYKTGGGYDPVPADVLGRTRAEAGYLAMRSVFSLSGRLDSCVQSSGSASAADIDVHTLGCRVLGGRSDCDSGEADYLDTRVADYVPSAGTYTMLKLAVGASCADVRAALP